MIFDAEGFLYCEGVCRYSEQDKMTNPRLKVGGVMRKKRGFISILFFRYNQYEEYRELCGYRVHRRTRHKLL